MSIEYIIIIILSVLIFFIIMLGLLFLFKFKHNSNKTTSKQYDKLKQGLIDKQKHLDQLSKDSQLLIDQYKHKLENLAYVDYAKLEQEVKNIIVQKKQHELNQQLLTLNEQANEKAAHILVSAMQHLSEPIIQEMNSSSIKLLDEQMKGRIIGKEGRNKRCFEILTGTDLIIEKDNSYITISSHNPIRREVAVQLLTELIKSKTIEPARIETTYSDLLKKFEQHIYETGQTFVEQKLKIFDLPHGLYDYVGRLKYRSSYGQNTLQHVWECCQLASNIAKSLDLDPILAIKCALLHDIGKSIDYEIDQDHVSAGIEIVKKFNLDAIYVNAVQSHHGHTVCDNIYSEIVAIVDTASASRPGARINSYDEYIERVQTLEKIVNALDEVSYSYAIRSGRQLRVIVNPSKMTDNNLETLAAVIKNKLENDNLISGYNIKVVIIKENRYEFETQAKKRVLED